MPKVSFRKETPAPASAPAPAPEETPTAALQAAVDAPGEVMQSHEAPDNIGLDEIIIPKINLVQKSGALADQFTPGDLLLNKDLVLVSAGKECKVGDRIEVTFLELYPMRYSEQTEGEMGRLYNTTQEVAMNGGTISYDEAKTKKIPLFKPLVSVFVAIRAKEGLDDDALFSQFPVIIGGANYALAIWHCKGGAYNHGVKVVNTALKMGHLRQRGLRSASWKLGTRLERYKTGNTAYVPDLIYGQKHSDEVIAEFDRLIGK